MHGETGNVERSQHGSVEALNAAGEDEVFGLIEDGIAINKIARYFGVSRRSVYNWINAGGDERRKRLEDARRRSAEALIEQADEILEDVEANTKTPQHTSLAKERVNHLRFKAAKLDRATWGEQQQALNVNMNFGELHLAALQRAGNMSKQIPSTTEPMPAEVVPNDEDAE